MRLIRILIADLKELLENKEFVALRSGLRQISPFDLAEGWEYFTPDERIVLFKLSPRQNALQMFEELEPDDQEELLKGLKEEDVEDLVSDLDPTETGRILRELPEPLVRQLAATLKKLKRGEKIEAYLRYPEESVGALMRSNYLSLSPQWSCAKALERIQMGTLLRIIETTFLDELFVVQPDGVLLGTVTLKELVVAPREMTVGELMDKDPEALRPESDRELAAQTFARYKLESAPVVDKERRLLGVVLAQDIVEVVEEEIEEDIAKFAGTQAEEFEAESPRESARHRAPWLFVTLLGQVCVSLVIRGFESVMSQLVALATFMPLIAAMGGNVGSQSAIIMVRKLSTGEIDPGQEASEAVMQDFKVGLLLGAGVAALLVLVSHVLYGARFGWMFSLVAGGGVLMSMSVSATLGALVPLVFKRIGVDPATATGPIVTTMTDILSTTSYLALAAYLLFG